MTLSSTAWPRVLLSAALLLLASPSSWAAPAGTVDSLSGQVSVTRSDGSAAQLRSGDAVAEGDTLSAGKDSWALLEMSDGASITIRPETRMRVDAYRSPEGNPSAARAWLSLLTGALRVVTGAIGHNTPSAYRVSTSIATIGVRGTDHEPAYYPVDGAGRPPDVDPGVYDKVNEGETVVRGGGGDVSVKPGQAAFLSHREAGRPPRLLPGVPKFYARHAALDRHLADRVKSIRERHQHNWLRKPGANARPSGDAREQHRDMRERAREHRREMQEKHHEQARERREAMVEKRREGHSALAHNHRERRE